MKVCALISGGKDSCFNMIKAVEHGHEIVVLANLCPQKDEQQELDSFCFQTVGHNVVQAIAEAMELPLIRRKFSGVAVVKQLHYAQPTPDDEVEDLYELLLEVKRQHPDVDAVSCGAILSSYQRLRVESVCARLQLKSLAYMWQRDQVELLNEMIACNLNAILIKVASFGVTPREHLGKSLSQLRSHFMHLHKTYGFQPCGEGGEYETFTLDCSLFKSTIVIDESRVVETDERSEVGHFIIDKYHLERKKILDVPSSFTTIISGNGNGSKNQSREGKEGKESKEGKEENTVTKICSEISLVTAMCAAAPAAVAPPAPPAPVTPVAPPTPSLVNLLPTCSSVKNFVCCSETFGDTSLTLEHEMRTMMETMQTTMSAQGVAPCDIMYVNLYVTDMSLFSNMNKIYCQFFGYNPPSRACVQICSYLPHRARCMADCMGYVNSGAAIGDNRVHVPRDVLHVQSISEWAPTCIGPYSQANVISGLHLQAAQIGLDPASMVLVSGGVLSETIQALQNTSAVLKCLQSSPKNVIFCMVWVNTNPTNSTNLSSPKAEEVGVRELVQNWLVGEMDDEENEEEDEEEVVMLPRGGLLGPEDTDEDEDEDDENFEINQTTESADTCCKISFVQVPNLPRGAAVELQIIAVEDSMQESFAPAALKKWMVTLKMDNNECLRGTGIHLEALLCLACARFESSIGISTIESQGKEVVQRGFLEILRELNNVVSESKLSWSTVNQLHIYCCGDEAIHAGVRSWFLECWTVFHTVKPNVPKAVHMIPALSFVPVDGSTVSLQVVIKAFDVDGLATHLKR